MEQINGKISQKYFSIKQEISDWNFEKLVGIGKKRAHDKYAILELNICKLSDYSDKEKIAESNDPHYLNNNSFLVWKLSESQFPKETYEYGKNELIRSAEAVVDLFSIIKEQKLDLVFEIVWAGYGIADVWGKGVVDLAFVDAILSCFDNELFQQGLENKKKHPYINGEYQSRYS